MPPDIPGQIPGQCPGTRPSERRMKTTERRHLKQDKLAETLQDTMARLDAQRTRLIYGGLALAVLVAGVAAYSWYRTDQASRASALLADALVVAEAPITPPPPPPGVTPEPAPPPPANSFATEEARREAALAKFVAAAEAYPTTRAGITARYHAAGILSEMGKVPEAREQFERVAELDGRGIYARMARLGIAELNVRAANYEPAIATFRELSLDTRGDLPIDAILMQLGQAYSAAGKATEAQQAFQRLTTEFPESPYAGDAKRQLDTLEAGA